MIKMQKKIFTFYVFSLWTNHINIKILIKLGFKFSVANKINSREALNV